MQNVILMARHQAGLDLRRLRDLLLPDAVVATDELYPVALLLPEFLRDGPECSFIHISDECEGLSVSRPCQ